MLHNGLPEERLRFFQEKVGLCPDDMALLDGYSQLFVDNKARFGQAFWDYFQAIERTSLILEQHKGPRNLQKTLANWFGDLFSRKLDQRFLLGLWNSGLRHVEISLDQRFVNLGYAMARSFCHDLIAEQVSEGDREPLAAVVDRMLDFCVLVATDSFVTTTSRCDRQVIEGIAHQVRNPVTVIGGNIKRLQRQVKADSQVWQAYDRVLKENMRLERMLRDVAVYTGLFQSELQSDRVTLKPCLEEALKLLETPLAEAKAELVLELESDPGPVLGDGAELETMFYYLLENCVEALPERGGRIRVALDADQRPRMARVVLENNGQRPDPEALADLFQPFHSTKPLGTGFGLPIAAAVARRHLGGLSLEPGREQGAVCRIALPLA